MHSGLSTVPRFIAHNLLSLLAIACILALGSLALDEWRALHSARSALDALSRIEAPVRDLAQRAASGLATRSAGYRQLPLAALDARIATIDAAQRVSPRDAGEPFLRFPLPAGGDLAGRLVAQYKRRIDAEVLRQEKAYLQQLRAYAAAGQDRLQAMDRLRQLNRAHIDAYARYAAHAQALRRLGWLDRNLISHPALRTPRLALLDNERMRLLSENNRAFLAWQAQRALLARIDTVRDAGMSALDPQRIDTAIAPLQHDITRARSVVSGSWLARAVQPVVDALPAAALVLALAFAVHLAVKAFFFFVLAPMATRLRPIRLLDRVSGELGAAPASSAVSQSVSLAPSEQLLILPDYVQSAPVGGVKRTRWLLDWTFPWTSLISGMVALTSIRIASAEPVVLSASEDASSELALIVLAPGSAMVLQPRCLVGVIVDDATPLRITSHWRLATAHAWLTLQLRYLVFHGPATLVVSGSRGVRVEAAGQGRLISQAATLGFSANLAYSTIRCDTFYPYYAGKAALLQDLFAGGPGFYVYDETPSGGKNGNAVSRGLEGVADGILKVFGL